MGKLLYAPQPQRSTPRQLIDPPSHDAHPPTFTCQFPTRPVCVTFRRPLSAVRSLGCLARDRVGIVSCPVAGAQLRGVRSRPGEARLEGVQRRNSRREARVVARHSRSKFRALCQRRVLDLAEDVGRCIGGCLARFEMHSRSGWDGNGGS